MLGEHSGGTRKEKAMYVATPTALRMLALL